MHELVDGMIINRQVMIELLGDDIDSVKKFEISFVTEAHSHIQLMIQTLKARKFSELKEQAHYLKTSARAIGAEQSANWLQLIEDECLDGELSTNKFYLQQLIATIKNVQQEIVNG